MPACTTCGTANREGARFCDSCGSALAVRCGSCGAELRAGARFCDSCGTPVGATADAPAPAQAISERRLVSVLFADLVGFTTLSEHRDPEEIRELLSRYFERCRTLIERYGGVVEKFIGDAVMAVWGTPVAREDDAERAVRAALALTQAVTALGPEIGMPDLRVRAGVLTGPAAVEVGAEGEGMVLGDTVNTASRLQSIAEPGTVLVDDVTRRASEAAIAYDDAGTHSVKGRDQPVRAWTARSVVAGVGGARRSPGLEAPFVGREAELEYLLAAWERSAAEGAARRVTVVGDAGAGKSRLLWELFKHVDGVADRTVWWHQGRCLSYGEGVGYWALAEMVRSRAGIGEDEEPEEARAKLRATVEQFVTDERERRLVEPRLAHLLGLERRVAPDRADLYSGWRLFFERMAAIDPVVLAFEDLQWADSGLLDFIDHLLEWSGRLPIFVLALGRPELSDLRPAWPRDLVLAPLQRDAVTAMLDGLVPGLPSELARRIVDRAEGVPLYAVETVRMLLDRGVVTADGARYAVTGDVGDLDIPETLHALVAARLDALDPTERAVLQDASVMGQSFFAGAVAAVGGRAELDTQRVLDGLCQKQLLRFEDDPRGGERGQYHFLQAMVRTVAYATLSRRDRKARHLAAARHLQEAPDSADVAEVLAAHFLAAAEAEPDAPDAGRIRASACETLAEAGRRALSLALGAEAQRAFDHAAELAEDAAQRADLLEQAGRAAWRSDDLSSAHDRLESAIAGYEATGRTERAARARGALADVVWNQGRLEKAIDIATGALAALPPATAERAELGGLLGKLLVLRGDFDAAASALEEALTVAESEELWATLADALITKGSALQIGGRPQEGYALLHRGTELAEANDLPVIALRGHNNLCWTASLQDEPELVRRHSDRALEIARARGDRNWERMLMSTRGAILAHYGDWDAAEADLLPHFKTREYPDADLLIGVALLWNGRGEVSEMSALEGLAREAMASSDPQVAAAGAQALALVADARGDHERVLELGRLLLAGDERLGWHRIVRLCGEHALALGRTGDARAFVAAVADLPPAIGRPSLRASADHVIGLIAAAEGDIAGAERAFERAAAVFGDRRRVYEQALVHLDHGELLAAQGREEEAEPLLWSALGTFERLRAEPRAERARAALATCGLRPSEPRGAGAIDV